MTKTDPRKSAPEGAFSGVVVEIFGASWHCCRCLCFCIYVFNICQYLALPFLTAGFFIYRRVRRKSFIFVYYVQYYFLRTQYLLREHVSRVFAINFNLQRTVR
jgi:hypothetical protein